MKISFRTSPTQFFKTRNISQIRRSVYKRVYKLLTRITGANIEDLVSGLNVLSDDILETRVALIPVELLLVLLVTVFPVFLLSVLGHFLDLILNCSQFQFVYQASQGHI